MRTYLIARRSASRSTSAPPSLMPRTRSPSLTPTSALMRRKPAISKALIASCIRCSVDAPTMTRVMARFSARQAPNAPLNAGRSERQAPNARNPSQRLFQTRCKARWNAELHDLVDRRLPDRLHRAEVSQERAVARGADSLDRVERRGKRLPRPHLAVMRDRKSMRLVADTLDEKHPGRVSFLNNRLGAARREDLLALLCQREGWNVRVPRRLHHLESSAQLTFAAVDEDQVGPGRERPIAHDVRLLPPLRRLEPLQPSPQDLLQHREVVWARRVLDPEVAVVIVPRPAVLEYDHRPNCRVALDVGDVIALDTLRRALEVERLGQRREHRLGAAPVVVGLDPKLLELLLRSLGQLCDQAALAASLWDLHGHRAAALLAQPTDEQLRFVDRARQDDRTRHVGGARVVLQHEAAQQLRLSGVGSAVQRMTVVADHLALPHIGDFDEHVVSAPGVGDDVLVVAAAGQDPLPVRDPLDRLQLIAVARRVLEVQPACRRFHPLLQLADQDVRAPFHEQRHLMDPRLVVLGADPALAWSRTALDVKVEADLALLEDLVRARPKRQELADGLHGRAQRLRRRVRAEVESPVVLHPARVVHTRKVLCDRKLKVEVVLIVFEPDVVARPVVLDQVVLEDERLDLVRRGHELEVVGFANQLRDLRGRRVARREVRAQAVAQTQGLADVDHLAPVVAEHVDARALRHGLQPPLDRLLEGYRHMNGDSRKP